MLKKAFEKTKYELCILVFLLLQVFAFTPPTDGMTVWQMLTYLGDYSHGYMPRAFLGEVISWFTPTVSLELLWVMSVAVIVIMSITIALLCGQIIKKAENKSAVVSVIAVMLLSPIFMPLFSSWLGIVDIYLITLTLFAFILNENRFLRYLVPVIMPICVAIHHAYMFLYMVPLAIALLYDCIRNKKYIRDGIFCGITYISLIAFALFTVMNRTASGFGSLDEMIDFMINKADFALNKDWLATLVPNEYFTGTDYVANTITKMMSPANLLGIIVVFSPVFVTLAYGWIKAIKHSDKKEERLVLSLCLIHPLSAVPAYVFGLNWNRWTSAIITSQCILYLFMLYRKNNSVSLAVNEIVGKYKKHFIIVVFYLIYYASFAKLLGI
ncbi:MAG: hypothetical protein IIU80_08315 [Clostridia bacterium]|nr:hypothetical protein [Clostridia bacterium]